MSRDDEKENRERWLRRIRYCSAGGAQHQIRGGMEGHRATRRSHQRVTIGLCMTPKRSSEVAEAMIIDHQRALIGPFTMTGAQEMEDSEASRAFQTFLGEHTCVAMGILPTTGSLPS
ncbi:hypothetical protein VPNG_07797 [Cytospora leucostoma]|uniref:Uncharacterized protein n=1 Tax=Cytospora leucostoma TaxID=1230097 RepID=A0A423WEG7_9PEZI|nr:hypothetical protein VPNG_07797 [Cytospora leucostoma]